MEAAKVHDATSAVAILPCLLPKKTVEIILMASSDAPFRENLGALGVDLDPANGEWIDAIDRENRQPDFAFDPWNLVSPRALRSRRGRGPIGLARLPSGRCF